MIGWHNIVTTPKMELRQGRKFTSRNKIHTIQYNYWGDFPSSVVFHTKIKIEMEGRCA